MYVYKAQQVIAHALPVVNKPWEMPDERNPGKVRTGVSNYQDVTVLSVNGSVAVIRLKGKTEEEFKAKVAKLPIGKPAEIVFVAIKKNAAGVTLLEA